MGGHCETVVFAGIDDELGGAAEAFQRLVHLLTANDGNVPVDVAAHEKSGGGDVVHAVEGRDFFPDRFVFPRVAEFGEVVFLVLIVAESAGDQGYARTGDGGLEARGLGDDEVGGHAAVGPAADAEPFRIGDALGDSV